MGYFSNGTEGLIYAERYCDRCVNQDGCFIWDLHMNKNYEDCNKPDSILHVLIPLSTDKLSNEQCVMFQLSPPDHWADTAICGYCKSEELDLKHEPWCKREFPK